MNGTLDYLAEALSSAYQSPFRGQIYEYARKLNLQNGYAVKGEFRVETVRHLIEPLEAVRHSGVRLVSIMGAVQTTKSLIADLSVPHWVENDPGDTLWLLEDDAKVRLYAERALGLLCSVPEIMSMLEGVDRSDRTKTQIKFKHMKLAMCGLNPGNVQSLSWKNVIVDETWLHPFDGLIRQAIERAKQYPNTKKVLLMGQGGAEDDDHDVEHKQTDQRELHYACPFCGRFQPFGLNRERTEQDLALIKPRMNTDRHGWGKFKVGTFSGLSWDVSERTRPGGRWNYEEAGRSGHHRCHWCDGRIEDRPEVREALNASYCYFPLGTAEEVKLEASERRRRSGELPEAFPFPERVGFWWPEEASIRVPFRETVIKYLRAKTAAEELSYQLPLKEFYQKSRGRPWSEVVEAEYRAIVQEVYDALGEWEEERFRVLVADCQRDLKKFFYSVFAIALTGETRMLARGECASFDEIAEQQKKWKVADQRVFLDCGYQMTKVLRECVKRGHVGNIKVAGKVRKVWLCWTGLKGSGIELFRHKNPRTGLVEWKLFSEMKYYNVNVGTKDRHPKAPWFEWSNLHVKDLLRDRRDADPSAPKWLSLPDKLPPTDQWSYFAQMRAERRVEEWTPRGKRAIWKLMKETRPNHDWDIGGMCIAFQARAGIIASDSLEADQSSQEVDKK